MVWLEADKDGTECIYSEKPQKVCGNNPVLVVGLRNGRISYRHL